MVSQQDLFMIYNNFILMATRWKIGKRGREAKKWSRANIKSPQKMLQVQRHGRAQWFFWLPSSSCPAFKSWLLQILLFCTPMILVALHGGTLLKKETSTTYFQQRGAWIWLRTLAFKQHRYILTHYWYPQHQKFPSKFCPVPVLLNFSVRMGNGESNIAWPLAII